MRRLWAASAAIVMCLVLAVPAPAQDETEVPGADATTPDTSTEAAWPSALELRRALSDIGWQWGADEDLIWYGGPPPGEGQNWFGRVTLSEMEFVRVDDGQGVPVTFYSGSEGWVVPSDDDWLLSLRMRQPSDPVYGWPDIVASDWTLLAEAIDLLPIDGVTRFQIRRTLGEPGSMPQTFEVPGGVVVIEADDSPGYWATVQFYRLSDLDPEPTASPPTP